MTKPPVPKSLDLRRFGYMPLEVDRLRRSKTWRLARRDPRLGFWAINLWCESWHEVPAGSLPNDDDDLCDLAQCDPDVWPEVKENVLRGWRLCADGRLYHPVVCEKAREAFEKSQRYSKAAKSRWNKQKLVPASEERGLFDATPTQVQKKRRERKGKDSPVPLPEGRESGIADPSMGEDPRAVSFARGRALLARYDIDAKKAGGLVGRWLKLCGSDDALLHAIFDHASEAPRGDIVAYVEGTLRARTRPVDQDRARRMAERLRELARLGVPEAERITLASRVADMSAGEFTQLIEENRHGPKG